MKINWQYLKYLFNDKEIKEQLQRLKTLEYMYTDAITELTIYKDELEEIKQKHEEIIKKKLFTEAEINYHRITSGRNTQDKPSSQSPLTLQEMKNITKNIVASKKELHVIELYGDTNSMEPNIDDNHIIIMHKYDPKTYEIKKMDIVRYYHPTLGGYVLHRVIDINKKNHTYLIRGDNNPNSDGWIAQKQIVDVCCGTIWGRQPDGEVSD